MDKELKALAAHALQNAYFTSLCTLLASYIEAADGLDIDPQMFYEVHGFSSEPSKSLIAISDAEQFYDTLAEALIFTKLPCIFLQGQKVFERRDGEWFYVEKS